MSAYDASTNESLEQILLSIDLAAEFHEFALYFVQCSLLVQQDEYIDYLEQRCKATDIALLRLNLSDRIVEDLRQTALDFLNQKFSKQIPERIGLVITGLEASILLDSNEKYPGVLQTMNLGREKYQTTLPYSFIIWLSDEMLRKVQTTAPDFWSWRSAEPERFAVTQDFLEKEIETALSLNQIKSWFDAVAQVSFLERLLEAYSESYNHTNTKLELLSRLGTAYEFLEKYPKARNSYEKALDTAQKLSNSEKRASVLNNLGIAMREMRDLDQALEFFQEYLKFAEEHGDLIGQGAALNNIGLIYLDKEKISGDKVELSDAVRTLEHALVINEKSDNLQALSNTLGNLGFAYYKQGNIDSAIEYYYHSLEISQKLNDQRSYWKDLLNLGLAHSKKGELETAFRYYSEAADVSHRAGDLIGEKKCLIYLAECASKMEKHDPIVFYKQALEIAQNIKDDEDEYNILAALADTYQNQGSQERAISYFEEALSKVQELSDSNRELHCYASLIQLHGRDASDNVERYKEKAKLLLKGTGKLKIGMLNAWLVDASDHIPGVLAKDKRYALCLNIGSIPEKYLTATEAESSEIEKPLLPVAQTEFIYNLVANSNLRSHEIEAIGKTTETPQPTPGGKSDVSAAVRLSDQSQLPIDDLNRESGLAKGERKTLSFTMDALIVDGEKLSDRLIGSLDDEALIDIEVNIEGKGFDIEKLTDTLKTSWEHGSDLLVFPVTPRELGENKLIIQCDANGIPFDTKLSVSVEESLVTAKNFTFQRINQYESGGLFIGEFSIHERIIKLYQGDITNLVTDVIVSSDDNLLTMSGGVSMKIYNVGGDEIYIEARKLIPLSLGDVAVTTSGKLSAKKIFHGVVIDFGKRKGPSREVIQQVVHDCMEKANKYGFRSIAFPLLGTGTGGFSAIVALETILSQLIIDLLVENQSVNEVIITLYGSAAQAIDVEEVLKSRNFSKLL